MTNYRVTDVIQVIRDHDVSESLARDYLDAIEAGPSGTVKGWMTENNGRDVDTVQGGRRPWVPMGRTVDASATTFVKLGESRRDYKGMRVVGRTNDVLVALDTASDTEILYRITR